jgi:FtsZ-interacting cell division protein ZipA
VSTGFIVAIVVIAIIIVALLMLLPRMRATARRKQAERELRSRREAVADEHRQVAAHRETRAEEAERKARMAAQAAERERAEANVQHERASMHERGMADDQLIEEHERERFAGVAGPDQTADADDRARAGTDPDRTAEPAERSAATDPDRPAEPTTRSTDAPGVRSGTTDAGAGGEPKSDYERGREDERRRFERSRITDDVRESDRRS